MSRLDSFIRRMCAQRDILNGLVPRLEQVDGDILEFGLGSGRTFDHLRECFPERRILVFERDMRDGTASVPPPAKLIVGEIRETAVLRADGSAALVHADIDTGRPQGDAELLTWLPALVARLLTPGGFVVSSVALPHPHLASSPLPDSVRADRYFLARRVA